MLAAAASYALDHHVERLAQDHALARQLADGLAGIEGLQVEAPETNILFVDLSGAARDKSAALLQHLADQGIQATGLYRLISSALPSMQTSGGFVLAGATVILVGIAIAACYLPALKASRIDPNEALRFE